MMTLRSRLAVGLLLGVAVWTLALVFTERAGGVLGLHILDVGQGDAILLRSGSVDVLVDAGPDATVVRRLGEVRPAWDRRIEVAVLTHPQADHLSGFLPVLEREHVDLLLLPAIPAESVVYRAFIEAAIANNVRVQFARAGQRITVGQISLTVLSPDSEALRRAAENPNNGSVVLAVETTAGFSALLTGDIERVAEQHLMRQWGSAALDVDVLKVPHHGSRTSTSLQLLQAVRPSLAIMSVGAGNRFGHPHPAIVARLTGVPLLRTDEHGTVSLIARPQGDPLLSCTRSCGSLAGALR